MLFLTGSPVNVVISEAAEEAGVGAFGFAEFAIVGIPLVAGAVAIVMLLGRRLLPNRVSDSLPPDLSGQAATLVRHYSLDDVFHLRVQQGSPLIGAARDSFELMGYAGLNVITTLDAASHRPVSAGTVGVGDRLTVLGDPDGAERYAADHGLRIEARRAAADIEQSLLTRESGAAEAVVPPRSSFVGEMVRPGHLLKASSLVILAVQREGADRGPVATPLRPGDVLLVEGDWTSLQELADDRDLLVIDSPDLVRRQACR